MSASVYGPIPAGNLGNASVTVNPAGDSASEYVMPSGTMSANRTVTLGTSGSPATTSVVRVVCNDFAGRSLIIANGGIAGGTLFTFSGTPPTSLGASFYYDGTNWKFLCTYPIAALAVPNANLATMAALTLKGNSSGSTAAPSDLTVAQANALLGSVPLKSGSNLGDSTVTINPGTDAASSYTLPAATLSANRTVTLGTTGTPTTGVLVRIVRRDLTSNTLAIVNGGIGAGTLFTFPASPATARAATFSYDGTNWSFRDATYVV